MQMRFDGTLGFPGGVVDAGETPDYACSRECWEELGVSKTELVITPDDHIFTHYSRETHIVLHFFAKEISLDLFMKIEKCIPSCNDWGEEVSSSSKCGIAITTMSTFQVLGVVRCPLYTLPNSLGLPAFLRNQFIGNARDQLLEALMVKELISKQELKTAVEKSGSINCVVTKESIDY